jgi:hypothetical protein
MQGNPILLFQGKNKKKKRKKGNIIVNESQTEQKKKKKKTLKIASATMLPLLQSKAVREKQFGGLFELLPIVGREYEREKESERERGKRTPKSQTTQKERDETPYILR